MLAVDIRLVHTIVSAEKLSIGLAIKQLSAGFSEWQERDGESASGSIWIGHNTASFQCTHVPSMLRLNRCQLAYVMQLRHGSIGEIAMTTCACGSIP